MFLLLCFEHQHQNKCVYYMLPQDPSTVRSAPLSLHEGRRIPHVCSFIDLVNKCSAACQVCVSDGIWTWGVSFLGGTSVLSERAAVHACCWSLGQAGGWYGGHQAGWVLKCSGFFSSLYRNDGACVVSPVVADGQQRRSLLASSPPLKPEHKCWDHMG